jgi:hypothetical protein
MCLPNPRLPCARFQQRRTHYPTTVHGGGSAHSDHWSPAMHLSAPHWAPRSGFAIASLWIVCFLSTATAGTPDIVGTWAYAGTVQLEFKPDGKIFSNSKPNGTWSQRDNKTEYLVALSDGSKHIASLDKYKRSLTTTGRSRGEKRTMQRIDNGLTVNPDVPDQRAGWQMECADLETTIEKSQGEVEHYTRKASELWQRHSAARAIGRISSWNVEARRAEATARSCQRAIEKNQGRIAELNALLSQGGHTPVHADAALNQDPVVGRWRWGNGPHTFYLHPDGTASQKGRQGQWKCVDASSNPRQYRIKWDNGKFLDSFSLVNGGNELVGANQHQKKLFVSRISPQ